MDIENLTPEEKDELLRFSEQMLKILSKPLHILPAVSKSILESKYLGGSNALADPFPTKRASELLDKLLS